MEAEYSIVHDASLKYQAHHRTNVLFVQGECWGAVPPGECCGPSVRQQGVTANKEGNLFFIFNLVRFKAEMS